MKVFKDEKGMWSDKVNFVDDNNVVVGFDLSQDCCENADYFFSKELPTKTSSDSYEFPHEQYQFDPSFFKEGAEDEDMDGGGMVTFKLVNPEGDVVYLSLYNHQNGYYGHGFTVKRGEEELRSGVV